MHAIDGDEDWPIVCTEVPANLVYTDGNDLAEYGYDGPAVTGLAELPAERLE